MKHKIIRNRLVQRIRLSRVGIVYAVLRGSSVCYRINISRDGVRPLTTGSVISENEIRGLYNGIVLDLVGRGAIVQSNTIWAS